MKHDLHALADAIGRDRVAYVDEWCLLIRAKWQDVIGGLPRVDAVITDPPYSERTHGGQRHGRRGDTFKGEWCSNRGLGYEGLSDEDACFAALQWSDVCGGWCCVLTSHDLVPSFERGFGAGSRYVFAPLPVVMKGMNCRLAGDGPSSWSVHMLCARPRSLHKWGTLPGAYVGLPFDEGQNTYTATRKRSVVGGKPLWLMRALVRDYSREGDLVADFCAGGATTLLAARLEGRQCIGVEMDPDTCALAARRLERDDSHKQTALFKPGSLTGEQSKLFATEGER